MLESSSNSQSYMKPAYLQNILNQYVERNQTYDGSKKGDKRQEKRES